MGAILITQALVRALIVLAIDPLSCITGPPSEGLLRGGKGQGRQRGEAGESRPSALYLASIKGSLSEQLCGPKKGMFILQLGDGLSQGKEWTAHEESCLPVRPGLSS